MTRFIKKVLLSFCSFLFLVSCAEKELPYADRSVNELYNSAMDFLYAKHYVKAETLFSEIERQHPYSNWSLKAQIMAAYCLYEAKKYEEAIERFKAFIQLHPGHEEIGYAHYMIGLCYYEQIPIIERDQKPAEQALHSFEEILSRFPDSSYAKDVRYKIELIHNHLAAKELSVGRYYQAKGAYLSAVNRFQAIIELYPKTSHVPEALHRLVESYSAFGLFSEAKASAAVLGHNYPSSFWYQKSYALVKEWENKKISLSSFPHTKKEKNLLTK